MYVCVKTLTEERLYVAGWVSEALKAVRALHSLVQGQVLRWAVQATGGSARASIKHCDHHDTETMREWNRRETVRLIESLLLKRPERGAS